MFAVQLSNNCICWKYKFSVNCISSVTMENEWNSNIDASALQGERCSIVVKLYLVAYNLFLFI